jgi:2-polyprenyl-6-methoxyphenol hydroxylase-like FAD-dependent oxidoreductase
VAEPTEHGVVIVGAGPGGLCLAAELGLAGVPCTVLERRALGTTDSRALGLQSRTLELLAQRDLVAPFIAKGNPIDHFRITIGSTRIDLNVLDTDYQQVNICPQYFIEQVLHTRAVENGAVIERGVRVTDVRPDGDSVVVRAKDADGVRELRASWVVGCDGPNSLTREALGIGFPGHQYPYHVMFGDVLLTEEPAHGAYMKAGPRGLGIGFNFGGGRWRVGALERRPLRPTGEVPMDELAAGLRRVFGSDLGAHDPLWTSRAVFRLGHATSYRRGRVLLLGDAAHVQSPLGGQGLNLTLQDAMNLGWKLAAVAKGRADARLLDTYEWERRAVASRILAITDRGMRLLMSGGLPQRALRRVMLPTLTSIPPVHNRIAGYMSGVGFDYRPIAGQGWSRNAGGRRLPNLRITLHDDGGERRLHELLHRGRFVLIDQGGGRLSEAVGGWAERVTIVAGRVEDRAGLGRPAAILCRPDGYCGWAGDSVEELRQALTFWCGTAAGVAAGSEPAAGPG